MSQSALVMSVSLCPLTITILKIKPLNKLASDTFTKGALRKEEMKTIDSELIKEKLKQPWLSHKDIYQIYPVGEKEARKMFNAAKEKANGCWMPNRYVPKDIVLELYPIRHKKRIARNDS